MAVPKMTLLVFVLCGVLLSVQSQSFHPDSAFQSLERGETEHFYGNEHEPLGHFYGNEHEADELSAHGIGSHAGHEPASHLYGDEHEILDPSEHELEKYSIHEPQTHAELLEKDPKKHHDHPHGHIYPSEELEVPTHEDSKHPEPIIPSPYDSLCRKITLKLLELESRYPELKSLKLEFLERLDIHAHDLDVHEGESAVSKFLDLVVKIADQLRVEFIKYKHEVHKKPVEEIVAEHDPIDEEVGFVGSVRGIPGVNYPNYSEVPITSFSCSDKKYIPGFYADLETGCQVFHVCYEHRRESFLCPVGTIFNQPILACDYWYSSNCSQAPIYYDVNEKKEDLKVDLTLKKEPEAFIEPLLEDLKDIVKFLPVKAQITEYPKEPKGKVSVSTIERPEVVSNIFKVTPKVVSKPLKVYVPKRMPAVVPKVVKVPYIKPKPLKVVPIPFAKVIPVPAKKIVMKKVKIAKVPMVKAKLAKAVAVDIAKTKAVKAKLAVAVDVAKTKAVKAKLAKAVAVDVAKTKAVKAKLAKAVAVDVAKTKVVKAAAVPLVKAKVVKAAVPVVKAKVIVPVVKAKRVKLMKTVVPVKVKVAVAAKVPVVKAKALVLSPLTKKALAIGYKKLLKAKKLGFLG